MVQPADPVRFLKHWINCSRPLSANEPESGVGIMKILKIQYFPEPNLKLASYYSLSLSHSLSLSLSLSLQMTSGEGGNISLSGGGGGIHPSVEDERQSLGGGDIEQGIANPRSPNNQEVNQEEEEEGQTQNVNQEPHDIPEEGQTQNVNQEPRDIQEEGPIQNVNQDSLGDTEQGNKTPSFSNSQDKIEVNTVTLLETVYLALMGFPVGIVYNFNSIFKEKDAVELKISDLVLNPTLVPLAFYTIVLCTVMFGLGLFMTTVSIWRLRAWSFSARYLTITMGMFCVALYSMLVAHNVPRFYLSFWLVWIYVLVLTLVVLVMWVVVKIIFKLFS